MSDWPQSFGAYPAMPILSTVTPHCLGTGALVNFTLGSSNWPAANRAIFLPFRLATPFYAQRGFVLNGGSVSGNFDIGIYDEQGARLASIGSTARATVSVIQAVNFTAPVMLGAGLFYLAVNCSTTSGTFGAIAWSGPDIRNWGICMQDVGATALPQPATFATYVNTVVPLVGISDTTSLP